MQQYLDIARAVINAGNPRPNRTGERTIGEYGFHFSHDMNTHFPILSTKYVPMKSVIAELVGFLTGASSAATFRDLGTKIWDDNANHPGRGTPNAWLSNPNRAGEDDLGRIYGVQWRNWRTADGREIDQLENLITGIKRDPFGRRHIVTAWNPGELHLMALPPCHDYFQVHVVGDETSTPVALDLFCHMRSVDVFLGMPFNIASYGALLHAIAHIVGLKVRKLHFFFGDTHIYESHLPEMLVQIRRTPLTYDQFGIKPRFQIGYTETTDRPADDPQRALHGELTRDDFYEYSPRRWGESQSVYEDRVADTSNGVASPITELHEFEPSNFYLRGYTNQGKLTGHMAV